MSLPQAKDLSHLLSDEARSRRSSPLKELFVHMADPAIRSLAGGLPLPALFPFDDLRARSLAPPFDGGISQDILHAPQQTEIEVIKQGVVANGNGVITDIPLNVSLQYGTTEGNVNVRNFIREHTNIVHKVAYEDWDVILTCGNTFAWDCTMRNFCNRGDIILADEFAFTSALESAHALGLGVVPVKMDLEGIDPKALEEQMANWPVDGPVARPKLLYTIPTGQNPTGSCLSAERRAEIYKVASKYDFIIVEDEPYYYLQMPAYDQAKIGKHTEEHFTREEFVKSLVPSFLDFDTEGRVIRLDSFSKVLAPGTRLGWIVAQKRVIERYTRLMECSQQVPSGFSQSIVNGLLQRWGQDGYLDWLMQLRHSYTVKRDIMCDAIHTYLPQNKFQMVAPVAGMFIWIKVDARLHPRYHELNKSAAACEEDLLAAGLKEGVLVVPGTWFRSGREAIDPKMSTDAEEDHWMYFRGTFASVTAEQLVEAIQRLGQVFDTLLEPESI